jgi:hypothetical protein
MRADEPALRELLRTNALGGWIRLAFQREPDAFAATFGLARAHDFIIAHEEGTGRPVGLCERFVRDAYVNGAAARLPYLGSLRVNAEYRNRIRILRNGFVAVRDLLQAPGDLPFALTSITADNDAARRILCAGISGFPQYQPAGEMLTFAIRTRSTRADPRVTLACPADLPAIAELLQQTYQRFQFAPVWRSEELARLDVNGYLTIRRAGQIAACIALWDQSRVKQTIVCGYSKAVERLRPVINAFAPLVRAPRLPAAGSVLRQVYLSHLALTDESADDLIALLRAALSLARERGFDIAVLGLAGSHPLVDVVRRNWSAREYRSLLHVVQWPGRGEYRDDGLNRIPHPEVALM